MTTARGGNVSLILTSGHWYVSDAPVGGPTVMHTGAVLTGISGTLVKRDLEVERAVWRGELSGSGVTELSEGGYNNIKNTVHIYEIQENKLKIVNVKKDEKIS